MADEGQAILLMVFILVTGLFIGFNLFNSVLGINLGISFNNISNIQTAIWIILARLVGLIMMILSIYVVFNIIKNY